MRVISRLRPSPALAVAFLALVVAVTGVGLAAIPDRSGVIRACRAVAGGDLRVIDTARRGPLGRCRRGERSLAWSQRGRPGVAGANGRDGANGAPGAAGNPGAAGVAGATNVVVRFAAFMSDANGLSGPVHIQCQAGERATGGGIGWTGSPGSGDAVVYSGPEDANFSQSTFPQQGATPTGWAGDIKTSDGADKPGRVYAICASP
jgi:hypothetical protein